MVRKDPVIEKVFKNYTKKIITIRPDKDDQVFTFKQIKKYIEEKTKDLPKDSKFFVRGLNILRDTTLKGYEDDFMTQDDYDEYSKGKVKDATKFDKFYNFTITIQQPNNQNMFMSHL